MNLRYIRMLINFTLLFLLLFFPIIGGISAPNNQKNDNNDDQGRNPEGVTILNAYYTDWDLDGEEDDVVADVEFSFKYQSDQGYDIRLTIDLILPSGFDFNHKIQEFFDKQYCKVEIIMLNHAIEPGWYDLYIEFFTKVDGTQRGVTYLLFDPPGGGQRGGDPLLFIN